MTSPTPQDGEGLMTDLVAELAEEDRRHPAGFPATRDGIRYGIATVEDEIREVLEAWREERRQPGWQHTRDELLQVAGNALRIVRSIDGERT